MDKELEIEKYNKKLHIIGLIIGYVFFFIGVGIFSIKLMAIFMIIVGMAFLYNER